MSKIRRCKKSRKFWDHLALFRLQFLVITLLCIKTITFCTEKEHHLNVQNAHKDFGNIRTSNSPNTFHISNETISVDQKFIGQRAA